MGMSADEYWNGDADLVIYYRQAEELKNEKLNQELWLQGMYIYEAIADISPILHAFAKKGTKPKPYPSQPYSLTTKQQEKEQLRKDKAVYAKGKQRLEALMTGLNKKFAPPEENSE